MRSHTAEDEPIAQGRWVQGATCRHRGGTTTILASGRSYERGEGEPPESLAATWPTPYRALQRLAEAWAQCRATSAGAITPSAGELWRSRPNRRARDAAHLSYTCALRSLGPPMSASVRGKAGRQGAHMVIPLLPAVARLSHSGRRTRRARARKADACPEGQARAQRAGLKGRGKGPAGPPQPSCHGRRRSP